ncbi:MAG: siderophore biosynthesis protein [Burkholderiaceae bacterium]|nr:siderophore biosynthesis protein [Burkholderiaceae bacterium]
MKPSNAITLPDSTAAHAQYICRRVLDALLREDVRACVSGAAPVSKHAMPAECAGHASLAPVWLEVAHFGDGRLWIPVAKARFMQDWRSAALPLLWRQGGQLRELHAVDDILACFAHGLPAAAAALFEAFAGECRIAAAQRALSETERERWFAELADAGGDAVWRSHWHTRLLHYDRLGAFLDHPLYPTARAKLGFEAEDLAAYGPEFQRCFQLRWLAVPRALHHPSIANEQGWPAIWPGFADVGLPPALGQTHALMPVHPFVWGRQLDAFLGESGWHGQVICAPQPYLTVAPTLSVRTVALLAAPPWHLKLPLTIRTLGAKNIRTIKPSTIRDGHSVQTLLAAIAGTEPTIAKRLLLTHEECGAHADQRMFLGYILRRYPAEALSDSSLIPVASLLAATPDGGLVVQEVAAQYYDGDLAAFFDDYLALTLRLHLLLWLRYGIALESNQQNSVLVMSRTGPRLRLLLKDNDAARIHADALAARWPELAAHLAPLQDRRILVAHELPLAQMFTTITLQLNIAVLVEGIAPLLGQPAATLYATVRQGIEAQLAELAADGEDCTLARSVLLDDERLYIKYLLIAATLTEKSATGAADVNKFYGRSAPNFLRPA